MSNEAQQTQQQKQEKEAKREEMRQAQLNSILAPEAKERLGRIRLVKPEKVRAVEDLLLSLVQQQKISGMIEDAQLVDLLNQVSGSQDTKVKIAHKGKDDVWDNDEDGW